MEVLGGVGKVSGWLGLLPGHHVRSSLPLACYLVLAVWISVDNAASVTSTSVPNAGEALYWVFEGSYIPLLLSANWRALSLPSPNSFSLLSSLLNDSPRPSPILFPSLALLTVVLRFSMYWELVSRGLYSALAFTLFETLVFYLVVSQFCLFLLLISFRLKSLSLLLPAATDLSPILRLYSSLIRACGTVNRIYSFHLCVLAFVVFNKSVVVTYTLSLLLSEKSLSPFRIFDKSLSVVFIVLFITLVTATCDYTKAQAEHFRNSLASHASNSSTQDSSELYIHLLRPQGLRFSAKGVIAMERNGLISVIGTITTLVMVILQYNDKYVSR